MRKTQIYLDCDGVLIDSAYEAYSVMCLSGGSKAMPTNSKEFKLFQQLRPRVTHAWHYRYVWNIINDSHEAKKISIPDSPTDSDIKYQETFRSKRSLLKNDCYKDWLDLHRPFPFLKAIATLMNEESFTVLTTKDAISVESLLSHFAQWKNINIIDSRATLLASKGEIIKKLTIKSVPSLFIDDSIQNLESAKDIKNIKLLWATWGYVENAFKIDNTDTALKTVLSFLDRE